MLKDKRSLPITLRIVAVLFLLYGVGCVIGMVIHMMSASSHAIRIELGILGVPACFGLCRFSKGWRTFALYCIWIVLISAPIGAAMGMIFRQPVDLGIFGAEVKGLHYIGVSLACVLIFLIALWQYRVLTRPDIRALFYPDR